MSDDWKKQVDEREARLKAEKDERERKKQAEEEAKNKLKTDKENQERQREQQRKLAEHQRTFRCSYPGCNNTSTGPGADRHSKSEEVVRTMAGPKGGVSVWTTTNWDKPTGLYQCSSCHRYYCSVHYYNGKCKGCWGSAEK